MAERIDFSDLAWRLAQRVDQYVPLLLPAAVIDRLYWRVGSVNGEAGQSLSIERFGERRGLWYDHAAGAGGNLLTLTNAVRHGGHNLPQAASFALAWLGEAPAPRDSQHARPRPLPAPAVSPAKLYRPALARWLAADPLRPGDPVWRYLAGRGVDLDRLRHRPGALRYHPGLFHAPSQRRWPAMVAMICDVAGANLAVHRTWLEITEMGVRKAPVRFPKMTWGRYAGGAIHLGRGKSGRPWRAMPDGETLLLGEGIEDVLSGMQHCPDWRAAAGVSVSAMLSLELPPQIRTVAYLCQRDAPGSPAALLTERVLDRFQAQGRRILEWQIPSFVKDLNELDQKLNNNHDDRSNFGRPSF